MKSGLLSLLVRNHLSTRGSQAELQVLPWGSCPPVWGAEQGVPRRPSESAGSPRHQEQEGRGLSLPVAVRAWCPQPRCPGRCVRDTPRSLGSGLSPL